jgi:hypothetical protein
MNAMPSSRSAVVFNAAAAGVLVLLAWALRPTPGPNTFIDFAAYWSAGRLLIEGGNPYGYERLLEIERSLGWDIPTPVVIWNPPWVIGLLAAVAWVPFAAAKWCWFAAHLAVLLLCPIWAWRLYGGAPRFMMAASFAALLFFPCLLAVYYGQISPVLLLALVGMLWSLEVKRDFLAGLFLSLGLVKPHLLYLVWLVMLLWVVRTRRFRVLLGGLTSFAALNAVALGFRPSIYQDYAAALESHYNPLIWKTPTLASALQEALPGLPRWIAFLPLLAAVLAVLALWQRGASGFRWKEHLNFIVLGSVLTTLYAWSFDWVVLLPAVIEILVRCEKDPARNWFWGAGLGATAVGFVLLQASASHPVGILALPLSIAAVYTAAHVSRTRSEPNLVRP